MHRYGLACGEEWLQRKACQILTRSPPAVSGRRACAFICAGLLIFVVLSLRQRFHDEWALRYIKEFLLNLNSLKYDSEVDKAVKIQGTPYDRKRKITSSTLTKMQKLSKKNKTFAQIAKELGLNYTTVRYNLDDEFRKTYNATRNGAHTGKDHISIQNRVAYKRALVAEGKISV